MKLRDISNLTQNRNNSQFSLNLRAKQLKKFGITPQNLLDLKLPKHFTLLKDNLKVASCTTKLKSIKLKGGK